MNERAAKRPISSHRLFVPAIGLWFAVLVGAGLFLMPADVQATIATRTGLAAVLPLTAPPITLGGRLVISGLGALLGLLIGLVIAARIARANTGKVTDDEDGVSGLVGFEEGGEPQDRLWRDEVDDVAPVASPKRAPEIASDQPQRRRQLFNPREEMSEEGIGYEAPPSPSLDKESSEELTEEWAEALPVDAMSDADEDSGNTPDPAPVPDDDDSNIQVNIGFRKPTPHFVAVAPPTWDMTDLPPQPSDAAPATVDEPASPPASEPEPIDAAPRADLPLSELVARLGRAVEMRILSGESVADPATGEADDHVITFPRPDSGRRAITDEATHPGDDPQDVLRQALDKLSRVSNPK